VSLDLSAWLDRVGIAAPPATAEGLATLQTAQLRAIPFEDVTAFLGGVPDIAPDALHDRLIRQRRGGWCFELNGLLGAGLAALGFDARPVMCRVRGPSGRGGARSHLAFLVRIGGQDWLADTGFGGPGAPVPVPVGGEIATPLGRYRTAPADTGETVLERHGTEGWAALYGWEAGRVQPEDIAAANFLCARWEGAPFPANLMASRLTVDGRVTLLNRVLKRRAAGEETATTLTDAAALHRALSGEIGLPYGPEVAQALWDRLAVTAAGSAPRSGAGSPA
jgi:N-hydroxyarylamine O-acetyltransferase